MDKVKKIDLDLAVEQLRQAMTTHQEQSTDETLQAVNLALDCLSVTLCGDVSEISQETIEQAYSIKETVEQYLSD